MEDAQKAKERDFYRYFHSSSRPKVDRRQPSPVAGQSQPLPSLPPLSTETHGAFPSEDKALTAFAQLGALRLNARRCLISFFDRKDCYILAEATRTLSLQTGQASLEDDKLCWGTSIYSKDQSICYYTANLSAGHIIRPSDDHNVPMLVVNNLSLDPRFRHYPQVTGPPHGRFYAGVPIKSPSGHSIGTYCVMDDKPRDGLSPMEASFLKDMAITVMRHLEMTRAMEDHRRGGVMVRSLGAFAEGKSNIEDWWLEPPFNEAFPTSGLPKRTMSRRRRSSILHTVRPTDDMTSKVRQEDLSTVVRTDSISSSNLSTTSTNTLSSSSGQPGSAVVTPVSETPVVPDVVPGIAEKVASSAGDEAQLGKLSPEVMSTFTRAANIIREATEADNCVFFDAQVSTFGGLVEADDDFIQESGNSTVQDKACAVLGAAKESSDSQGRITESVLRYLLRVYPHGQIFNLDEGAPRATVSYFTASDWMRPQTPSSGTMSSRRPTSSPRGQNDEDLLKAIFPDARWLVLYPLWDTHRDRWFAGSVTWSSDPLRVFTSEQEISYLAAFSTSLMAEVARLDTKLADAAKGDFISSISHELRSPLHGILGSIELLKDTDIDGFQLSMAQTIETCGKTLLDTINHVLDFAKINNLTRGASKRQNNRRQSKQVLSPAQSHTNDIMTLITDVDMAVLTEEVLETVFAGYKFQMSATQGFEESSAKPEVPPIAIIVDINKSNNYVFRTQPGAWRRVLMNLFGNALKYTPAGYIKVKLEVTPTNSPRDEHSELRLTVSDSGIGMSEGYVNNRLFHSFVQENPLSQGTGLGLSIVKQIVASLGGEIEVQSQKGHGTKFTVVCPLNLSMMSPAVEAKSADRRLAKVRARTEGMHVSLIGFHEKDDYFPVKSLKNKNATMLSYKAIESLCTHWFGMKVQKHGAAKATPPDLFVATEAGAKWLRTQYSTHEAANSAATAPVVVLCQGAASAHTATSITVPGQIFECIAQPCGPHKMAKALTSCLDRYAVKLMAQSTASDSSAMPNVERLSLKENTTPTLAKNRVDFLRPLTPLGSDHQRPPMHQALSAPEIQSVHSSPAKASPPQHRPLHCLAVDDNPVNLRLLRAFIEKLHHTYTLAKNGVEALDLYCASTPTTRFDVVLMDINMPEMDGLEATRQIRARERDTGLSPVTIIALTGLASSETQQEAHISGVNLFLIKPVMLAELDTVLKGVVVPEEKKIEASNGHARSKSMGTKAPHLLGTGAE